MAHLYKPSTLPNTPQIQTQFMNVPLRHLAVTMTTIVITRSECIAHVMATHVYVITTRKQVLAKLVLMLPNSMQVVGNGKGATGMFGGQSVIALRRTRQGNVSGLLNGKNIQGIF